MVVPYPLPLTLLITSTVFSFFTNPIHLLGDSGGGWTTPFIVDSQSEHQHTFTTKSLWFDRAGLPQHSVTLSGSFAGNIHGEAIFVVDHDSDDWQVWVDFNKRLVPELNRLLGHKEFMGPFAEYDYVTSKPNLFSNVTGEELSDKFLGATDEVYRLGILIQAMSWATQGPEGVSPDLIPAATSLMLDWKNRLFNEWRQPAMVKPSLLKREEGGSLCSDAE